MEKEPLTQTSRQQRILEAKASFETMPWEATGSAGGRNRQWHTDGQSPSWNAVRQSSRRDMRGETDREEDMRFRASCRMIRWLAAMMLFGLLVFAFANDFSYRGFDREYVSKCLADDQLWRGMERQLQQFCNKNGIRNPFDQ